MIFASSDHCALLHFVLCSVYCRLFGGIAMLLPVPQRGRCSLAITRNLQTVRATCWPAPAGAPPPCEPPPPHVHNHVAQGYFTAGLEGADCRSRFVSFGSCKYELESFFRGLAHRSTGSPPTCKGASSAAASPWNLATSTFGGQPPQSIANRYGQTPRGFLDSATKRAAQKRSRNPAAILPVRGRNAQGSQEDAAHQSPGTSESERP